MSEELTQKKKVLKLKRRWIPLWFMKKEAFMEIKVGSSVDIEAHGHLLKAVIVSKENGEVEAEVTWPKRFKGVPLEFNEKNVIFPNDEDRTDEEDEKEILPKVILKNKKNDRGTASRNRNANGT